MYVKEFGAEISGNVSHTNNLKSTPRKPKFSVHHPRSRYSKSPLLLFIGAQHFKAFLLFIQGHYENRLKVHLGSLELSGVSRIREALGSILGTSRINKFVHSFNVTEIGLQT